LVELAWGEEGFDYPHLEGYVVLLGEQCVAQLIPHSHREDPKDPLEPELNQALTA
jgi:hypothetical protein